MLCRVADNVYWLGRYIERADYTARVLDVNTHLALDLAGFVSPDSPEFWLPLVGVSGDEDQFHSRYPIANEQNAVEFMLFDRENPSSIASSISAARENARCVRDQISSEMWEQINRLYLRIRTESFRDYDRLGASEYLNRTKSSIALFFGIVDSMMPRSTGWDFFNLGRFLERADNLSRLIEVKCLSLLPEKGSASSVADLLQWAAILRSCWAFEAFRKSRHGNITGERVIDYLVLDEMFPKSIRFSIIQAEAALRQITGESDHHYSNPAGRALGKMRADLDYATIEDVIGGGLREYMTGIQDKVAEVGALIEETFITYAVDDARILPRAHEFLPAAGGQDRV